MSFHINNEKFSNFTVLTCSVGGGATGGLVDCLTSAYCTGSGSVGGGTAGGLLECWSLAYSTGLGSVGGGAAGGLVECWIISPSQDG